MKLKLFKSLWGLVRQDGGSAHLRDVLPHLRQSGYCGVECSVKLAAALNDGGEFARGMKAEGLSWLPIVFSSGPVNGWNPFPDDAQAKAWRHNAPVAAHAAAIAQQIEDARRLAGDGIDLPFVNSHTGHDSMVEDDSLRVLESAADVARRAKVALVHETHRGRSLHSAWATARLLRRAGTDTHIIADYAHFTVAAEAAAWEEPLAESLAGLAPHVRHIHARVGYENGPQVPDPFHPAWQQHTHAFESIWAAIWGHQRRIGVKLTSATPEFGPPSYQHTSLEAQPRPLADIAAVNERMGARLAALFDEHRSSNGSGPSTGAAPHG